MLDDGLDEESKRRKKADEDTTGMLLEIKRKERASEEHRGPRPAIATRPPWRSSCPAISAAGASGLCWAATAPMRMHA